MRAQKELWRAVKDGLKEEGSLGPWLALLTRPTDGVYSFVPLIQGTGDSAKDFELMIAYLQ